MRGLEMESDGVCTTTTTVPVYFGVGYFYGDGFRMQAGLKDGGGLEDSDVTEVVWWFQGFMPFCDQYY